MTRHVVRLIVEVDVEPNGTVPFDVAVIDALTAGRFKIVEPIQPLPPAVDR